VGILFRVLTPGPHIVELQIDGDAKNGYMNVIAMDRSLRDDWLAPEPANIWPYVRPAVIATARLSYLAAHFPRWRVIREHWNPIDSYEVLHFLQPA